MERFAVALEVGPKRRVFAQALEWIGWCRAGKDEATALNHLVTAIVVSTQGLPQGNSSKEVDGQFVQISEA